MMNMMDQSITMTNHSISLAEALTIRSKWERLVSYRKSFVIPSYDGTIDNMQWFLDNGAKGNRFRKNYDDAVSLANTIVRCYHAGTIE